MKGTIQKLKSKHDLTEDQMEAAMTAIMNGHTTREEIADFLLALRDKRPTIPELTAAARIMRKFVFKISTRHEVILDTCGTGGDKKGTFNISTIAAFVVSGAGVVVAKHGNRSVSSRCGSADLLEGLGVNITIEQEHLSECLDEIGIAFLFAQRLHPAMKNVAQVRKELGVETIFNILGPLTNPAMATHQMIGVYDSCLLKPVAEVLRNLGSKRAMVVHGEDGLDEVTITASTFVCEFTGQEVTSYTLQPADFKIDLCPLEALQGGDLKINVRIAEEILKGKKGPPRDIVVLNAGCALYVAQKAKTIAQGLQLAEKSIDSGQAWEKLDALKEFTHAS